MDRQNPKQQVAEKLRSSANVLITVSKNPSVDQLSAAIGLSLMLNALGKHTATVYSGSTPDIISFLEPEKTFDSNVDGLRDFIISLSKEKADKLRYKVEDNVVKIFITPYKTKISEKDLDFSQGDFNVDAVIALGVKQKNDLDEAIINHGRILHDATVISVNSGAEGGNVGSIDWTDPSASCLSEMLVSISEALEGGILDAAMSTAFLTGIVSATERFSNEKTTPKLMTMAAQLMAAGANQQLISEKLQIGIDASASSGAKLEKANEGKDSGTLELDHSKDGGNPAQKDNQKDDTADNKPVDDKKFQELDLSTLENDSSPKDAKPGVDADKNVNIDELEKKLSDVSKDITNPDDGEDTSVPLPPTDEDGLSIKAENPNLKVDRGKNLDARGMGPKSDFQDSPSLGGTFNATSKDALDEKKKELNDGLNDELLSHDVKPLNNDQIPSTETKGVDLKPIGHMPGGFGSGDARPADEQAPELKITPPPGMEPPKDDTDAAVDDARREVQQAVSGAPFSPANNPVANLNTQPIQPSQNVNPTIQPTPPAGQPMVGSSMPPVMPPPMPAMAPQPGAPAPAPQQFQPQGAPQQPQPMPQAAPSLDPSRQSQTFNIPGAPVGTPVQQPQQDPIMHQPPPQQIQPNGDVPPPPPIGGLPPAPQ